MGYLKSAEVVVVDWYHGNGDRVCPAKVSQFTIGVSLHLSRSVPCYTHTLSACLNVDHMSSLSAPLFFSPRQHFLHYTRCEHAKLAVMAVMTRTSFRFLLAGALISLAFSLGCVSLPFVL